MFLREGTSGGGHGCRSHFSSISVGQTYGTQQKCVRDVCNKKQSVEGEIMSLNENLENMETARDTHTTHMGGQHSTTTSHRYSNGYRYYIHFILLGESINSQE